MWQYYNSNRRTNTFTESDILEGQHQDYEFKRNVKEYIRDKVITVAEISLGLLLGSIGGCALAHYKSQNENFENCCGSKLEMKLEDKSSRGH